MVGLDREPVVAGTFYSANANALKQQLDGFFSEFSNPKHDDVSAIIVPHAGYVYSGAVAASAYAQINRDKKFDNIFILGSSHHVSFKGASVYNQGNYRTPLGLCKVNVDIANALIEGTKEIVFKREAHQEEHTIEVQLPFMQHYFKEMPSIVPILVATHEKDICRNIANALQPYFNSRNLFVISSDFSHYPEWKAARIVDDLTGDAICKNDPDELVAVLNKNKKSEIPNLYTSLCGWSSVLVLLYMTTGKIFTYRKIKYQNSGDVFNENKAKVVGYQSIVIERIEQEQVVLSDKDKKSLLELCKNEIFTKLGVRYSDNTVFEVPESIENWNSAFVSVYVSGALRGCLGRFDSNLEMSTLLKELANSAAFSDHRFMPVQNEELKNINIEISLLTPMRKVDSVNEIELGKHGVYIKKGSNVGTFLPQVATKTNWTKEQFMGHLARDKARIGWNGWKDADIFVYEAIVFSDNIKGWQGA